MILPRSLWLWIPLAAMAVQIILETTLSGAILVTLHTENGPHELLQFFVLAAAMAVALATLFTIKKGWLAAWMALAAVCCFYVAGEEISWGQHFVNWATPEGWAALNDQGETNLHNTSSWLDQKPRLMLVLGVAAGGIVVPLLRRFRPGALPSRFAAIYPPDELWLVAALAILPELVSELAGAFGIILFERVSEVQELYLFYFVLLYLIAFRRRRKEI